MLQTIEFMKKHNDWRELLKQPPYCLNIDEDEDYVLLKYSQVDSDFNEQICRECRGLIVDTHTLTPIALSFYKFFNVQEPFADEIDWDSAVVIEKVDGSKILVWYNEYKNKWQISTSGKLDAYGAQVAGFPYTFGQLFDMAIKNTDTEDFYSWLNKTYCYTFELVSPESRVVVPYKGRDIYFIGVRSVETFEEEDPNKHLIYYHMKRPYRYLLRNLDECLECVKGFGYDKEGFVVVDKNWHRVKIKGESYLQAHYLKNNGVNSVSRMLEIVEANEQSEFLSCFPEYKEYFDDIESKLKDVKTRASVGIAEIKAKQMISNWTRKDFAQYIMTNYKDVSGILFKALDVDLISTFVDEQWKQLSKEKKLKLLGYKEDK